MTLVRIRKGIDMTHEPRCYLLVYNDQMGSRKRVRGFLDKHEDQVLNWRCDLPNTFYIISRSSADELYETLKPLTDGEGARFLVTEVTRNKQGWLPKKTWKFMNEKPLAV